MAEALSGSKQYGDTQFEGDGNLHQGDDYRRFTNRIQFRDVIFNLPPPLAKRCSRTLREQTPYTSLHQRQIGSTGTRVARSRFVGGRNAADDSAAKERAGTNNPSQIDHVLNAESKHLSNSSLSEHNPPSNITESIQQSWQSHGSSAHSWIAPLPTNLPLGNNNPDSSTSPGRSTQTRTGQEFLWLCASIMSYLLLRQVSGQEVLSFLIECPQDQLFPILTCIFGAGLYRFVNSGIVNNRQPLQHTLLLEDAYGQTQHVDFDLFTNLNALEGFLLRHYDQTSGSAAKYLMQHKQYHLMLGSRRGAVLQREEWASVTNIIKPGYKIVNAVYIKTMKTTCLSCGTPLIVSEMGEFHCFECQTFCRDYDTLVDKEHHQHADHDTSATNNNMLNDEQSNYYQIERLKNVDMRIVPLTSTHRSPKPVEIHDTSQDAIASHELPRTKSKARQHARKTPKTSKAFLHNSSNTRATEQMSHINQTTALNRATFVGPTTAPKQAFAKGIGAQTSSAISRLMHAQRGARQPLWSGIPTIEDKLIFNLRRYTHAAYCVGNWNPESQADHSHGRQAVRAFASQLKAGRSLYNDGKTQLALSHWQQAQKTTQDPNLLNTWYHETPTRLLFELSCMAHSEHITVVNNLLEEIRVSAEHNLQKNDARYDLFQMLANFDATQLRSIHSLAAQTLYKSLEHRLGKSHHQLHEVRLNRALDMLWFDAKADVADWLPSTDNIDQVFAPHSPFSVYFLLLEAYRLVAIGSYDEARRACLRAESKLRELETMGAGIDYWRIGLAYYRLGNKLRSQGCFEEAFRILKKALDYVTDREQSAPVMAGICEHLESIATILDLPDEVSKWSTMLSTLEQVRS